MKNKNKNQLFSALVVFCAGILLFGISFAVGAISGKNVFDEGKKTDDSSFCVTAAQLYESAKAAHPAPSENETNPSSPTALPSESSNAQSEQQTPENKFFTNINISGQIGKISIRLTDKETRIEFTDTDKNNVEYYIENSTLFIDEPDALSAYGFNMGKDGISFKGIRYLFRFSDTLPKDTKTITLFLNPEDFPGGIGNVTVLNGYGDCSLQDFEARNLTVRQSGGNIEAFRATVAEKCVLKSSYGDIFYRNVRAASVELASTTGNIELYEIFGKTSCESNFGNVTVYLAASSDEVEVSASSTVGKIYFENEDYGTSWKTKADSEVSLWAYSILGDVFIYSAAF